MNENTVEGSAKAGVGKLAAGVGDAIGDQSLQAKGSTEQVKGKAQDAVGSVQQAAGDVIGQAKDAASKVTEQAKSFGGKVEPYVKERPYAALAIAGAAGFLISQLFFSGGSKTIYVKSRT